MNFEQHFKHDLTLKVQYIHFLDEYRSLGHMRFVEIFDDDSFFYLPYHGVFKCTRQSAKIRVVFNASCKTTSRVSLNDVLRIGPIVQSYLADILMRFRNCRYVISADVIKMYRQILVDPTQMPLQGILWRSNPASRVDTYELSTVTYCFSVIHGYKMLNHLAEQFSSKYRLGSAHVKRNFYVDDLLIGTDTLRHVKQIHGIFRNL